MKDLDELRKQLVVQERKILEGERQTCRLQEEANANRARPMPERQEGLPVDLRRLPALLTGQKRVF